MNIDYKQGQKEALKACDSYLKEITKLKEINTELLEACKLAFERLQPGNDIKKYYNEHVAYASLGKAIAKAEGRIK